MYPPKIVKKAPRFGKLREIHRPFFNLDHKKGNLKFTANCTKSAQFANLLHESCEISAIRTNS